MTKNSGRPLTTARGQLLLICAVLVAGCSDQAGERFGPVVTNECAQAVVAGIGASVDDAEQDIRDEPVTLQPGSRSSIDYVVQNGSVPPRLFLMVGVDAESAATLEIETGAVQLTTVELAFAADCRNLVGG